MTKEEALNAVEKAIDLAYGLKDKNIKTLIEDYNRRLKNITNMIETCDDYDQSRRLKAKAGCYQTFIIELNNL